MTTRICRLILTISVIAGLLFPLSTAGETSFQAVLIAEGETTNRVHRPATDGTYVAWLFGADSPSSTCKAIYATSIEPVDPVRVQTILSNSRWALSGGVLIWTNEAVECVYYNPIFNPGVYGLDLTTGDAFKISSDTTSHLDIADRMVVWIAETPDDNGPAQVRIRHLDDVTDAVTIAEVPPGTDAGSPRMRGTSIYWLEYPENGSQQRIVRSSVDGKTETILVDNDIRWFDVHANTIVWQTSSGITAMDLISGSTHVVRANESFDIGTPATDGRYVFWITSNPLATPHTVQLQAFDLATGSRFTVTEYSAGSDTMISIWNTDISNGLLVWDNMVSGPTQGGTEIRAARLVDVLPTAPRPSGLEDAKQTYFPETGHYLGWGFRDYWTANGGLPVFGYPLTEEFTERNLDTGLDYAVQFTERQRFEWHPDNTGTPYEVLLGRLGAELLMLQGRDWTTFPKADPTSPAYFPETGHTIAPEFRDYWSSHGLNMGDEGVTFRESLALFGYPLSEPMMETNADGDTVLTQYFERAVFEYHPTNPDPYTVLLRRLGVEMLIERDWLF